MGADQFDERYERDRKEKESYFSWYDQSSYELQTPYLKSVRFYWSINLGAAVSYTLVSYICQYGIEGLGGEKWGFFVGYLIPCCMMAIAICVFVSGTSKYRRIPQSGSVVAVFFQIIWEGCTRSLIYRAPPSSKSPTHILDRADTLFGGSHAHNEVNGAKLVTRLLPFLAVLIPFWGVYSQMNTAFQNQGCQMDLRLGAHGQIPVSALNLFNTMAILLFVPLFDSVVYPVLRRLGFKISLLDKMRVGFFFSLCAMVTAAIIEISRLKQSPLPGKFVDESARMNISPCHDIDDYNPLAYQRWLAGEVRDINYVLSTFELKTKRMIYPT
jgi:solute carrier family 15 (peptide/histidine transporter), member 3/4